MRLSLCLFSTLACVGAAKTPKLKWAQDEESIFLKIAAKCADKDVGASLADGSFKLSCGNHALDLNLREDIIVSDSSCRATRDGQECKLKKANRCCVEF